MAVSRSLRRLLHIRTLEEEQCRAALESALSELSRLEQALAATEERDGRGRRLVDASARSGELPDRLAGIEETRTATRHAAMLTPRIAMAKLDVVTMRQKFLEKRIERRQAETLIQETEARDAIESGRRTQLGLDDWYRFRLHRAEIDRKVERPCAPVPADVPGDESSVRET